MAAFVRHDSLAGARFGNGPLARSRDCFACGVAVSWIVGESSIRVRVDD